MKNSNEIKKIEESAVNSGILEANDIKYLKSRIEELSDIEIPNYNQALSSHEKNLKNKYLEILAEIQKEPKNDKKIKFLNEEAQTLENNLKAVRIGLEKKDNELKNIVIEKDKVENIIKFN